MFDDEELIPISSLQHLMFCERQWALIHMEQEWVENVRTIEGQHLHERVHQEGTESRGGVRLVRGLRLRSLALGLYGVADLVEFHDGSEGWTPYPVEYKRGRKRYDLADEVQLCAQAICLEEMLGVEVPKGAIYYGLPRRRSEIELTRKLRGEVTQTIRRARELFDQESIPVPRFGRHCSNCSLNELCMPQIVGEDRSERYIEQLLKELV